MKKIALEKKLHIVEVYESEVEGYLKNGWTLVIPAKSKSVKSKSGKKS